MSCGSALLVGRTREQCKAPTRRRGGAWSGYTNATEVGARKYNKDRLWQNQRKLGFSWVFFVGPGWLCSAVR